MRRFVPSFALALLAAVVQFAPGPAVAQALKEKTIKFVVPFPPGGTADVIARLVGQQLGQANGQKTIVENRPGAGTIIGSDQVARATADGANVLVMSNSFVINAVVRAQLPYDPWAFEPVCMLVDSPQVLAVHESAPYRTLKDFVDAAKAKPGELSFAAVGPATTQHIAGEMFKLAAGVNLTYVPFTGGAPAVNALLGNHVTSVIANYNEAMEHLASGKLRPLAVASRARLAALPNVPTFIEAGYKDFETSAFFGVVATPKTPPEAIRELQTLLASAIRAPEVAQKLAAQGLELSEKCGEAFRTHIRSQYEKYAKAIKEAGIKTE